MVPDTANSPQSSRQVVVLAGGLGTRMLPRTETVPKVLLEVAGRPFASWLLERLVACGYDDIVLCIGHLGGRVRELVGERSGRARVRYVDEGQRLRGTGGAIALAAREGVLQPELLVTYGDSYLPFDYAAPLDQLRERPDLDAVMAVFSNQSRWDKSNVALTDDGTSRVARYEKGSDDPALQYIDYGATAIRRSLFEGHAEDAVFGLDSVQHRLAKEGRMGAYVAAKRFYEIGSPRGLADLESHLRGEGT